MGWLAWSTGHGTAHVHPSVSTHDEIACGAMMFEADLPAYPCAVTLLDVRALHPEPSVLRLQAIPGQGFTLLIGRGKKLFHATLSHTLSARTNGFRLTFNWDASTGEGSLTIEHPGEDALFATKLKNCPPMPGALILGAISQLRSDTTQRAQSGLGFHKGPLAVGPGATLEYHTPVLTPYGYEKIGKLRAGDTVIDGNGDVVPVLAVLKKTVPPMGSHVPVRLRAPYFGLQCDIIMAGMQRMIAEGSDVEYTFGRDNVLIPAQHLVNGTAGIWQDSAGPVEYYQLLLPGGQPLVAGGIQLESLFVGRLRRRKDIFDLTTLAGCPRHRLPEHVRSSGQVLKPFEAIIVAEMRAA